MFKLTRYRLGSSDATLMNSLKYDFIEYVNALNNEKFTEVYWRKAVELKQQDYFAMYKKKINDLVTAVNNEIRKTNSSGQLSSGAANAREVALSDNFNPINAFGKGFFINIEDMSDEFQDFTVSMQLKDIVQAASLKFRNPKVDIQENDLFEVKENDKIIFLGFVTNNENAVGYGDFDTVDATILNVGKMYSLARITINRAFANYALDGRDLIFPNVPVLKDIFNNKNTFEIIEAIMSLYFYSKKEKVDRDSFKYIFNDDDLKEIKSLNINFTMLYTLYLYYKIHNPNFVVANVSQGQHKTYNLLVNKSFQVFEPEFKTVSDILGEVVNGSLYDMFIDYSGDLVVRPPLYNYLGKIEELDNVAVEDTNVVVSGRNDDDFIINNILRRSVSENNTDLEIRTDAYFSWNFFGAIQNKYIPGFYEDLNALMKFGFRNNPPYANPNAMNWKTASILAAIMNHIVNNGSRNISLETIADRNFQLGRLYYLQPRQQVGYLIKIEKKIAEGEYVRFVLTFTFLRNVEFLDVGKDNKTLMTTIKADDWSNEDFLYDLYNIYTKFGLFGIFNRDTEITVDEFNRKKSAEIQKFRNEIIGPNGPKFSKLAAFKVMPSILDLIELVYSDPETKNAVKQKIEAARTSDFPGSAMNDGKNLMYFSFKSKLQAFFKTKIISQGTNQDYKFENDKTGYLVSTKKPFYVEETFVNVNQAPYSAGVSKKTKDYLENSVYAFNKILKLNNEIKTFYNNYQQLMEFAVTTDKNVSSNSVKFRTINTPFLYTDLRDITQKLVNRICEADAEMKEDFPLSYSNWPNEDEIIGWIFTNIGSAYADLKNSKYITQYIGKNKFENDYFSADLLNLPLGYLIIISGATFKKYSIPGDRKQNEIILSKLGIPNRYWFFMSPGFNMNMETLIKSNIYFSILTDEVLKKLEAQEGNTVIQGVEGKLLKQHNNKSAVDIILPDPSQPDPLNFILDDFPGTYRMIKKTGITYKLVQDYLQPLWLKYFDDVISTRAKYKDANNNEWSIKVWHLGLEDNQYINPNTEVFRER